MSLMTRCVAFDLDGTLVDSFPALRRAYVSFLGGFGLDADDREFARLNGPSMATVVALLKEWRGLPGSNAELLAEYHRQVNRIYAEGVPAMAGAEHLLSLVWAKGWRRALVTSSPRRVADAVLAGLHWEKCFDVIACGDEVAASKPDPAVYRLACERGNWAPADCVAIEDAEAGVRSAKACGLRVIGVGTTTPLECLERAGADWTCRTLDEAGALLRKIGEPHAVRARR